MRFNWNYDYVKGSKIAYIFSIILTITGIVSILGLGLNYAVDFRAGSNVDISVSKAITAEQINPIIKDLGVDEGDVQVTTGADRVNVRFSNELMKIRRVNSNKNLASWIHQLPMRSTPLIRRWQKNWNATRFTPYSLRVSGS